MLHPRSLHNCPLENISRSSIYRYYSTSPLRSSPLTTIYYYNTIYGISTLYPLYTYVYLCTAYAESSLSRG